MAVLVLGHPRDHQGYGISWRVVGQADAEMEALQSNDGYELLGLQDAEPENGAGFAGLWAEAD
jgi:hypothetical protein